MTNRKTTKKALLGSLLALVLCFSMLVGTTFAWFTDSEFIKENKIQAGTLDIELDNETPLFTFDKNLWEPGYSEYAENVLTNVGNLALKYTFSIENLEEIDGEYDNKNAAVAKPDGSKLSEVLEVYVGTEAADMIPENFLGTVADLAAKADFDINADITTDGDIQYLLPGESKPIELIVHMMEEAGNEYMNDYITFDVAIVATQFTYEKDEWDNDQYDKDALYPAVTPYVANRDMIIENVKVDVDDYADQTDAITVTEGNVTINSGHFDGGTTPFGGAGNTAVWANGVNARVEINGGYFTIAGLAKDEDGNLDSGHIDLIYASNGGRITINGGFFEGADDTVWLVNCKDRKATDTFNRSMITIKGGTFVNWNPATANDLVTPANAEYPEIRVQGTVTEEVQDNGDVWYIVD